MNSQIVDVLMDVKPEIDKHPSEWKHWDGRSLTEDELDLVLEATPADFEATRDAIHLKLNRARVECDALRELGALLDPYFAQYVGITVVEILPMLTEGERCQYDRLMLVLRAVGAIGPEVTA